MNLQAMVEKRVEQKLSQQEMAEFIGLRTAGGYLRIEKGQVDLKAKYMPKIAEKLNLTIGQLTSMLFNDPENDHMST